MKTIHYEVRYGYPERKDWAMSHARRLRKLEYNSVRVVEVTEQVLPIRQPKKGATK